MSLWPFKRQPERPYFRVYTKTSITRDKPGPVAHRYTIDDAQKAATTFRNIGAAALISCPCAPNVLSSGAAVNTPTR